MRILILATMLLGCPLPPPCLPDSACPPTPAMEQSCLQAGGQLAMIDCAEDGSAAWACCYEDGGCVCFDPGGA